MKRGTLSAMLALQAGGAAAGFGLAPEAAARQRAPFRPSASAASSSSSSTALAAAGGRRGFLRAAAGGIGGLGAAASLLCLGPSPALAVTAVPKVTVDEFLEIARVSAKSVAVVEFSGPKSELALAKLVDGTYFQVTGLVESPSDPRSPLKLAASCRSLGVPTRFLDLELAVGGAGNKRKKVYANARVQEAARKEREKAERIAEDEGLRLTELREIEAREMAKVRAAEEATAAAAADGGAP